MPRLCYGVLCALLAGAVSGMRASWKMNTIAKWNVSRVLAVLYMLGKTVAHVLSLPLALHHTLAPRLEHLKDDDPDSHKYDNVPPELALFVAVLIVLKMVYGLDGRPR
jgi:RNA polymerase I-specific transcription initiation factor RRN7